MNQRGETSIGCLGCALSIVGVIALYWLLFDGGISRILELLRSI